MPASVAVGTDCSGMEAPIQALRNLGVKVDHKFSCDVCKNAKATIEANFPPEKWYDDLTKRDNVKAPAVDVYVAGFPCQPFSMAGLQQGFQDQKGRGKIFFDVVDYIERKRPRVFMLENVRGLMSINNGDYFTAILEVLNGIGGKQGGYNIYHQLMNTKDHGVPHNRPRVYMIGVQKKHDDGSFTFPEAIPLPSLEKFLDPRQPSKVNNAALPPATATTAVANVKSAVKAIRKLGEDPFLKPYVVDCDSTEARYGFQLGCAPCITCGRAQGHWVTNRGRRLNKPEMMRLQGMDPSKFKLAVAPGQLGKQLGNTMSVNVLERILVRLLPAAGLARQGMEDRWETGSAVQALAATRGCELQEYAGEDKGPHGSKKRSASSERTSTSPTGKRQRVKMVMT